MSASEVLFTAQPKEFTWVAKHHALPDDWTMALSLGFLPFRILVLVRLRRIACVFIFMLCFGSSVLPAKSLAAPAWQEAQRPTSSPYSGDLSIFEYPDRDKKLQIERVMDLLGIKQGKNVADLGAGSGWFTVRAARRVGAQGTVFAEDISSDAIKYIDQRVKKENLGNVKTILGTPDDPSLPAASVDALLMLKVYHEIAHPILVMKRLRGALRPDARIGIIDRNGSGADHGLNRNTVIKEMGEAGYKLTGTYDFTKADGQDYFLIFMAR